MEFIGTYIPYKGISRFNRSQNDVTFTIGYRRYFSDSGRLRSMTLLLLYTYIYTLHTHTYYCPIVWEKAYYL